MIQKIKHNENCKPVKAIPNFFYHFVNWELPDGKILYENPINYINYENITANVVIKANFRDNRWVFIFAICIFCCILLFLLLSDIIVCPTYKRYILYYSFVMLLPMISFEFIPYLNTNKRRYIKKCTAIIFIQIVISLLVITMQYKEIFSLSDVKGKWKISQLPGNFADDSKKFLLEKKYLIINEKGKIEETTLPPLWGIDLKNIEKELKEKKVNIKICRTDNEMIISIISKDVEHHIIFKRSD